jgi:hypothetical protein
MVAQLFLVGIFARRAGEASGLVDGEEVTRVAVKQLNSEEGEDEFRKEVRIMQALSGCDRVVRLLGICTEGDGPPLMIMELMAKVRTPAAPPLPVTHLFAISVCSLSHFRSECTRLATGIGRLEDSAEGCTTKARQTVSTVDGASRADASGRCPRDDVPFEKRSSSQRSCCAELSLRQPLSC